MVKCTCGRVCKNLAKLMRHVGRYDGTPAEALHVPDWEDVTTADAVKRYKSTHRKGRRHE